MTETITAPAPAVTDTTAPAVTDTTTAPADTTTAPAPADPLADVIGAKEKAKKAVVELFVSGIDDDHTTYEKSRLLWHADVAGVKATAIRQSILDEIAARELSGTAPSTSGLSYIRTAWDVLLTAGINPNGRERLVARAVRAKNGRFSPEEIEAKSAAVLALADVTEDERAASLLIALDEASTKKERADKAREVKKAEKEKAEKEAREESGEPAPELLTLAEVISGAVGQIPNLNAEKLAELSAACLLLTQAIEAELSTRAASHVVTADTE